jgi:hypothetical protein
MLKKSASRGGGMAWLVPRAYGTPTMTQWSFDVRRGGLIQAIIGHLPRAGVEGSSSLARCGLAWDKARLGARGSGR